MILVILIISIDKNDENEYNVNRITLKKVAHMKFCESETVELKEVIVDDIKKEIIAFANCNGGKIYIGISDSGNVVGTPDPDKSIQQISNMVRDSIKPDITMFIHYTVLEQKDKQIISIDIQRGTNRPYYLAKKGLRPEGVYVRQGTSSVPASDAAIRLMIKETDGDSFEAMRALQQELTFQTAKKEFQMRSIAFGQPQMHTLKIMNSDGIYTNLGLLLSEQCTHTVKVAVFEGTDQSVFKDRREFTGSLLQQLNDVYDYIDIHNQTHATFDKLLRIDTRDYPESAIREALLNALVHRDYSFSASTLISIYTDKIEFVSIGGLVPGITLDDVLIGLSVCRNPLLANIFYRLQLIEAYGTGMRKIMQAYEDTEATPLIQSTGNAFKIILPNLNSNTTKNTTQKPLTDREEKVLNSIQQNGYVTRADIEIEFGYSQSTAARLLNRMTASGAIAQDGKGKNTKYILPKKI